MHTAHTGRRGRPRKEIDPNILEIALTEHRGPTHLAPVFNCSSRTVRRRALDYNIVEPGAPVYVTYEDPETGEILRLYRSSTAPMSQISDDELDDIMRRILRVFPAFGRRMIRGHLESLGVRIPRERLRESYERVNGIPQGLSGNRAVGRRVYRVAGPNSLWHHDGQHGMPLLHYLSHCSNQTLRLDQVPGCYPCFRRWVLAPRHWHSC